MKRTGSPKKDPSSGEGLTLGESDAVRIHSPSGEDSVLESADDFEREAAALGTSEKSAVFLDARGQETGGIPLSLNRCFGACYVRPHSETDARSCPCS